MIKKQFTYEVDREKWFDQFDKDREKYAAELKRTPQTTREKVLKKFSVRFTYDTQRIEGSTLSLRETAQLLEERVSPSGKPLQDIKEAEAHQRVFFDMLRYEKDLSLSVVLYLARETLRGNETRHRREDQEPWS